MTRIILHLDLNYFFAQTEEIRKPELKGKPLVVCVYSARGGDSGAVGTANYEARKLGIHSGMPIVFAKKKADKNTVFLPTDINYYKKVSNSVMQCAKKFSDRFEQASIDEAYLEITQKANGNYEQAKEIALQLKKEIFEKEKLLLSIGIGPNKLIAKIASGYKKPDGLTIVEPKNLKEFLAPLNASEIPGVGKKTSEALEKTGINTIRQLAKSNPLKLIEMFGQAKGKLLHQSANGIDEREIKENREQQQISKITTLKKNSNNFNEIAPTIKNLSKQVILRVKKENLYFKTIGLVLVTTSLKTISKSTTIETPSNNQTELEEKALGLFKIFLKENPSTILRRAGVRASNFAKKKEQKQKTLSEF